MIKSKQIITTGAELIAEAAMDAGVNFFAGYPITPASSIYSAMLRRLQAEGKIAIGASDEISALAMCIGASMRGAKSMTATSAPGLSLMVESIGYAFATETPVLIVMGQRLGPSTGAATQSAEGDINFVKNLISGGFHIPVIAVNSIFNSYESTFNAINTAEKLRCPVILLTEKDIIMSQTNIDAARLAEVKNKLKVIERPYRQLEANGSYKTYDFDRSEEIPDFVAAGIGGSERVVATASTHDKSGNLSKNSPEAIEVIHHLSDKIEKNIDQYSFYKLEKDSGAQTAVISFLGSNLLAKAAVKLARAQGKRVNRLSLNTLFPVPKKVIKEAIEGVSRVIIPEINLTGQYADIIAYLLKDKELIKINSLMDPIKPERILEAII